MQTTLRLSLVCLLVCLLALAGALGQTPQQKIQKDNAKPGVAKTTRKGASHGPGAKSPRPNLAKEPILYVVGYAHLDTEWRWEYPQVIQEYLTKTMRNNFALFEKYPNYIFNFTG